MPSSSGCSECWATSLAGGVHHVRVWTGRWHGDLKWEEQNPRRTLVSVPFCTEITTDLDASAAISSDAQLLYSLPFCFSFYSPVPKLLSNYQCLQPRKDWYTKLVKRKNIHGILPKKNKTNLAFRLQLEWILFSLFLLPSIEVLYIKQLFQSVLTWK